jgi:hypothetical protein
MMGMTSMYEFWLASLRAQLAMNAAALDTAAAFQRSYVNFLRAASGQEPDEDSMRDAFRLTADANVRRWADTANVLQTMPDWYQNFSRLPGGALTDFFDRARRG